MASSSSRKSSSSASSAPKPTYRRAGAAGKAPAVRKAAPKTIASSAIPAPARAAKSYKAPAPRVKAASKRAGAAGAAARAASKPTAVKAPAVRTTKTVKAAPKAAPAKKGLFGKGGTAAPAAKPASAAKAPVADSKLKPASKGAVVAFKPSAGKKAVVPSLGKGVPLKKPRTVKVPQFLQPAAAAIGSLFAGAGRAVGALLAKLNIPKPSRGALLIGLGATAATLLVALVVANSALFAATEIEVRGSAHVEQQTAQALVEVPDGTTLFNFSKDPILDQLSASPWVKDVDVERVWPHGLIITPVERAMRAVAYIPADEIAWAVGEDGTWIAPLTLSIALDSEGNRVELNPDGTVPEGAVQLSAHDAALRLAQEAGSLLLTDVPSDVNPKSGEPVGAKVVQAGLEYANGFTPEFAAQIKSLSVASVEAISAVLTSGVEVSLGEPENVTEKERVVVKLLEQEQGVIYINVREPGAYTFRSAPQ